MMNKVNKRNQQLQQKQQSHGKKQQKKQLQTLWQKLKNLCSDFIQKTLNYITSNKKRSILIGIISLVIIAILVVVICLECAAMALKRCGYQDILDQLRDGTYTSPTTGDFIVNEAGWIVHIQPIVRAEDPIKYLAEADKEHNIKLFVGYRVDVENKNIVYAFMGISENGSRYTVYSTQNVNRKFYFSTADYSELDAVFETTDNNELEEIIEEQ